MEVRDIWSLGEIRCFLTGGEFTVIPPNYAHTTNSDVGTVSKWEYLFIDVEGFMKKILDSPVKAEKMIQRIYSRALFLRRNESPSIAAKVLEILNIMRNGEEFYLEEAKGVLGALLAEIARMNRAIRRRQGGRRNRKSYKYDHTGIGLCFLLLYGGYSEKIWRSTVISVKRISKSFYILYEGKSSGIC